MPATSSWMIRASLAYLVAGFTIGGLLLAEKGVSFWPQAWRLLPLHAEILITGWLVQLALGVAFWILPRLRGGQRGDLQLSKAAAAAYNLGILTSLAALWFQVPAALAAGRVLEAGGAAFFLITIWSRVRTIQR